MVREKKSIGQTGSWLIKAGFTLKESKDTGYTFTKTVSPIKTAFTGIMNIMALAHFGM
jgi:hypothetical protein